jgi:ssDNA-binding replication factor A large subunit
MLFRERLAFRAMAIAARAVDEPLEAALHTSIARAAQGRVRQARGYVTGITPSFHHDVEVVRAIRRGADPSVVVRTCEVLEIAIPCWMLDPNACAA